MLNTNMDKSVYINMFSWFVVLYPFSVHAKVKGGGEKGGGEGKSGEVGLQNKIEGKLDLCYFFLADFCSEMSSVENTSQKNKLLIFIGSIVRIPLLLQHYRSMGKL